MLVLSRRVGERVVVGDDVTITVLEVRGDVVRIGIDAPRSVAVHRAELLEELPESLGGASTADGAAPTSSFMKTVKPRSLQVFRARWSPPGTSSGPSCEPTGNGPSIAATPSVPAGVSRWVPGNVSGDRS